MGRRAALRQHPQPAQLQQLVDPSRRRVRPVRRWQDGTQGERRALHEPERHGFSGALQSDDRDAC